MIPIAPQVATRIPATNNQTFLLRTNAAHASAVSAARASRSISLKYSTKKFIKTSPAPSRHGGGPPIEDHTPWFCCVVLMPVIGYFSNRSFETEAHLLRFFRKGAAIAN